MLKGNDLSEIGGGYHSEKYYIWNRGGDFEAL